VLVPLRLPHRLLAHLVGARRPTVSTALGQLEEQGVLSRRGPEGLLLLGPPPTEIPLPRRPPVPVAARPRRPEPRPGALDMATLLARVERQRRQMAALRARTEAARKTSQAIRRVSRERIGRTADPPSD
jgi:DNA-binding transcriptional MocR family regulator